MRDVEHPARHLLSPFIRVYLAARTAHPALATKRNLYLLPTLQADIASKPLLGITTTQHLLHFGDLVRAQICAIGFLVTRPIIFVFDDFFNTQFRVLFAWLYPSLEST